MTKLDIEYGDTLVVTMAPEDDGFNTRKRLRADFNKMFGDRVNIIFLPASVKLDLIKTSNLDDQYDLELRENNPALQDAWEKYQTVKGLSE
jgi:hypothetical protein